MIFTSMCVRKWKLILFVILTSFILGCQEEDNKSGLVTLDPVVIDNSTVQLHGKFTGSPAAGEELGFVWDGLTNPEYPRSRVTVSTASSGNDLYGELTNLDFGKIYYVRTYRKNGSSIHYGDEKSFTFGGLVPEIAHLVPASAHLGDTVLIVGKNFSADKQRLALQFGSLLSTIISASGDTVKCIVPHHLAAGPHPISIKVGSNLSNSVSFNLHHPSVLNFSPTSATFLDVIEIH